MLERSDCTKKYIIEFWIEDYVVHRTEKDDIKEAVDIALSFECDAFLESEAEEVDEDISYFVGVLDKDSESWILWANTDGKRGSDYTGNDPEILAVLKQEHV